MMYRISVFDMTTYTTHMIPLCMGVQNVNIYDNILYAYDTVESLVQVIGVSLFDNFMKGVKYDVSKILNLDDEFGNPIIIEQILINDKARS